MLELADIVRGAGPAYGHAHAGSLGAVQRRALDDIVACRTPSLGGTIARCDQCGAVQYHYHILPQPALSQVPGGSRPGLAGANPGATPAVLAPALSGPPCSALTPPAPLTARHRSPCLPQAPARGIFGRGSASVQHHRP